MNNTFIKIGSLFGAIGVAIGAFGAHLLKTSLEASGKTDTFETAVKYQFYGAFALISVGILSKYFNNKFIKFSGNLFLVGTIVFSGALYLICFTGINAFGAVAPIGGLCLIAAWLCLFISVK